MKILILEDDPIIAEDLRSFLESESFTVVGVAHNGIHALDMLTNRQPDIAIFDIHLGPGMSGLDVAAQVHKNMDIPFLFLTSFDDDKTLAEAQQHAPYGYIVKPFQERTLLTTIKMAMSNFKSSQQQNVLKKEDLESLSDCKITDQEHKIIQSLLEGHAYAQIAEDHFISINTVKYHAKNIYTKFQIKGRSQLFNLTKHL